MRRRVLETLNSEERVHSELASGILTLTLIVTVTLTLTLPRNPHRNPNPNA